MAYVGARLRQLRTARQLTQDQLAALTGITRTDLSGIENNRISLGPARAAILADALEVSVLELQPEAPPDARGLDLLDRLEALADGLRHLEDSDVEIHEKLDQLLAAVQGGSRQRGVQPTRTGSQP